MTEQSTDVAIPQTVPDIVPHHSGGHIDIQQLEAEMRYAELVAGGSLAPDAYRNQPGNVLIAWGLGSAMGLGRMESLYRIDVIKGKPAAAAELIAANVRKAGHRLTVTVNEEECWAEATITRGDEPDNPYTVRRDMAWARRMGLAEKDNYRKQPTTMLQWRAVSACARLACSEALYGASYTPDELRDSIVQGKLASAPRRASAATFTATDESAETEPAETGEAPSKAAVSAMFAAFGPAGFTSDARTTEGKAHRISYMASILDREITATADLTAADVARVTSALESDAHRAGVVLAGEDNGEQDGGVDG